VRFFLVFVLMVLSLYASRDGGPYIGGGYCSSTIDTNGYFEMKEDSSSGYKIYAGAYINNNFSVEFETIRDLTYQTLDEEYSFILYDINTQAHYQFFNRTIDTFLKFGVGEIDYDKNKGFSFVYGGGIAWWINERFSLKAGYDIYSFGYDENNDNSADKDFNINYFYTSFEVQF